MEPLGTPDQDTGLELRTGLGQGDTCQSPDHSCGRIHGNGRSHAVATSDSHPTCPVLATPGTARVALHSPLEVGWDRERSVLANELYGQE